MNTIKVKKFSDIQEQYEAGEELTPGHLVELGSDGKVTKHDSSQGSVFPMFVLEDELRGGGITDVIENEKKAQVWIPGRGDVAYALLKSGQNVDIGDWLVSNGDGTLKEYDAQSVTGDSGFDSGVSIPAAKVVGQAIEAVHANDGDARIKVRIY